MPVWVMEYANSDRVSGNRFQRSTEEDLELPAGRYELYLYSGIASMGAPVRLDDDHHDDSWWDRLFGGSDAKREDLEDALDGSYVSLSADGLVARDLPSFEITGERPNALIQRHRLGNSALAVTGFELRDRSAVRVYTLFEKTKDEDTAADYGWVVDATTREIVWSAADARSEDAGGHSKNRLIHEEIELEAGRYLLFYGTDDSHSFERFNTEPPHDPFNWGITLSPGTGMNPDAFSSFEPEDAPALADLTRVGDDRALEQAFRLSAGGSLHVLALGEADVDDGEFFDHGWIVDTATGEIVWEMTRRNTVGAGGAEKNRRFDGLVELAAGEYVLYYVTDGSHSYESFNRAAPFQAESWGVTVRPGPGFDSGQFEALTIADLEASDDFLVRMVKVRDDERRRERFTLEQPTRVRIYAIGEGDGGEMYDYGYLLNDGTGQTVWEMSWRNTRPAGGADKNRLADQELLIEPGTYEAVYVTDGSHSFGDWNASRPRDPIHWGLTIRRIE
jgi:hypothetical protein